MNFVNFLLPSLCVFYNLIIGEAAGPPPSNRSFLQVYITSLIPRRSNDQGNNNGMARYLSILIVVMIV